MLLSDSVPVWLINFRKYQHTNRNAAFTRSRLNLWKLLLFNFKHCRKAFGANLVSLPSADLRVHAVVTTCVVRFSKDTLKSSKLVTYLVHFESMLTQNAPH